MERSPLTACTDPIKTAQIAKASGARISAITRGVENQELARSLVVDFLGGQDATPDVLLDSAIIFAPKEHRVHSSSRFSDFITASIAHEARGTRHEGRNSLSAADRDARLEDNAVPLQKMVFLYDAPDDQPQYQ